MIKLGANLVYGDDMLKAMDVVQLKTTKRIRFMSGPPGQVTKPHGNWSIVGFIGSEAIIAKENTIVRVPVDDITKVLSMDVSELINVMARAGLGAPPKLSAVDYIMKVFDIDVVRARKALQAYNLPIDVSSQTELEQVADWLRQRKPWLK